MNHRILVVGTSCSGKSTFSRRLASILAIEHVELDALYWGPAGPRVAPTFFSRR
jgi:adenylate kinase family enzyme